MEHHGTPTLSEARERLRLARTIRDAARERGDDRVAADEEAVIAKMEARLAELAEAAWSAAQHTRPAGDTPQ